MRHPVRCRQACRLQFLPRCRPLANAPALNLQPSPTVVLGRTCVARLVRVAPTRSLCGNVLCQILTARFPTQSTAWLRRHLVPQALRPLHPQTPPRYTSSTSATPGGCGGAVSLKCCRDGPRSLDYSCSSGYLCGKGQCVPAGLQLCTDGSSTNPNYQCSAGSSCGRGVCVAAGYTLCGTLGTTTSGAGYTCCGSSPATRDTDMSCVSAADICPSNRISSTSYTSTPYVYREPGGGGGTG